MPLPLSSIVISEKNKLATDGAFLLALAIQIPGITDLFRVVRNNENITWQGETWVAIDFRLEDISEDSQGEVPRVVLRVDNVSRQMEAYLQAYDQYTKTNGFRAIVTTLYVLNSKDLASGVPVAEHEFELQKMDTNALWATFDLGASNPFNRRFPRDRMRRNHCRFIDPINTVKGFKGPLCKYAGAETVCDRTLVWCRLIGNSLNFGGSPGAGAGGIRVAS